MLSWLSGAFGALFGFLECLLLYLVGAVEWVLVTVFNLVLAALAACLGPVLALLPSVTLPSFSLGSFVAQANYFFPIDTLMVILAIVLPIYLLLPVVRTVLRWIRVSG
jgi:hypothetical protein